MAPKSKKNRIKIWLRKRLNSSFDNRLESFVLSLLDIEGLRDLLLDFGRGKLVFFQIRIIVELIKLKTILLDKHIPDAEKAAKHLRRQAARSKYREHLATVNFEEGIHEEIRFGYVKAFHKLEGFREELLTLVNQKGQELYNRDVDVSAYLKRVHKFKIDDLNNYPETIRRINWVSNCVKHYGGYPRKSKPPASCLGMDPAKKIVLSKDDLGREIDFLIQFTSRLFKLAMLTVACIRFEEIYDGADAIKKREIGPSIVLVGMLMTVYSHSLKEESDDDFAQKWDQFVGYLAKKHSIDIDKR